MTLKVFGLACRRAIRGRSRTIPARARARLAVPLRRTIALAFAAIAIAAPASRAQDETFAADRPWFTRTGRVLPMGRTQFEGGASFRLDRDAKTLSGPEFLLRVGLPARTEFRLGIPDYQRTSSSSGTHGRLDNTYVGIKTRLVPATAHYDLALLPGFTAPADKNERGDAAPEVVAAWSAPGWRGLALGANLGRAWRERARRGPDVVMAAISVGRELRPGLSSFVEWTAEIPDRGVSAHVLHHGYALAIFPDGQIDVHLGVGVTEAAPDVFIGGGFAVRH